jgi:hypothetical protein
MTYTATLSTPASFNNAATYNLKQLVQIIDSSGTSVTVVQDRGVVTLANLQTTLAMQQAQVTDTQAQIAAIQIVET